ncbi:SNF2 family DNA-dependent ATPase [Mycena chlorophos]|uniref:DNA helicase n=1 Tax=Mycena chlorophos TaxID=658473 RepID=A0A8H6VNW5_MYCCL|nr:SNF2 family DNA-dependent ATPase [Mycena chlorophos]
MASTKDFALDALRRHQLQKKNAQESSGGPHLGQYALPKNSRDGGNAPIPSRYFTSPPNNDNYNVLVPSSSPLGPSRTTYDPPYARGHDILAVSSALTYNGRPAARRTLDTNGDDGPPRKRQHLSTVGMLDRMASPDSPQVGLRVAKRRREAVADGDSDEDLPAAITLAGPSKPRFTRDRPTANGSEEPADKDFVRFRITQPTHSEQRIRDAWAEAKRDVKVATQLLEDPNWNPSLAPALSSDVGRVTEVDEASKALRLATRVKGQQSAIYANRQPKALPSTVTTTPTNKRQKDLQVKFYAPKTRSGAARSPSPELSSQPVQRRRVTRKMVVDSESDGEYSDSAERANQKESDARDALYQTRALEYFNTANAEALRELTGCNADQAEKIISMRPFDDVEDLETKLKGAKKKAKFGSKLWDESWQIFAGYGNVDSVLDTCEHIGQSLRNTIAAWSSEGAVGDDEDGALSLQHVTWSGTRENYLATQPALIAEGVQLKEYQLLGVNWLNLLYTQNHSCILADEMGLGKTIQVISFFAHLKAQGGRGPHLIIVPSSTLENWCREFARFAPSISIQTYYANKAERPELRDNLKNTMRATSPSDEGWEVLITTYALSCSTDEDDRRFFRRIKWDCFVADEGHILKNFQSQRYQSLMKVRSNWSILLTGTPLQNNLQELVSLLNFILPEHFSDNLQSLRAIFKVKGDSKVSLLAQQRVSRAKKMMTPFVLRRRKDQVLKDLPKKTERIEWCELTDLQRSIYRDALKRSRKFVLETIDPDEDDPEAASRKKSRPAATKKTYLESSSNVLMDLRKGALHPMLFRTHFTMDILSSMTRELLKEPDFKKRGALYELVKEDMSVMSDSELQYFCGTYKSIRKFAQDENIYLDSGKVAALLRLLAEFKAQQRKVLVFSQFTQVLDIIQAILKMKDIEFLVLTGTTPVDVRQSLVDEFSEREELDVFLLSTKAGGMGINLTAASVVVMFDQDFNPHNDRQAQDRAYRIGQKRDVEVIKLITRGTIEEDMLRLGETKLALDEAVAGDSEDTKEGESLPEREMKKSLLQTLRQQFTTEDEEGADTVAHS